MLCYVLGKMCCVIIPDSSRPLSAALIFFLHSQSVMTAGSVVSDKRRTWTL